MSSTQIVAVLAVMLASYLLGAVPFAFLVGKAKGVDIRKVGSGNVGATNVSRVLGRRLGIFTFFLDVLKGLAPMLLAPLAWSLAGLDETTVAQSTFHLAWLAVAASAIVGHMFPVYLRFKGGKGVATSLGVLLGVYPYYTAPALVCLAIWILFFLVTKYVSVASIIAAAMFPVGYVAIGAWRNWHVWTGQKPLLVFSLVMAFLVVYRHRSNIRRLLAGEEHRFGPRKSRENPA